MRRKAVEFQNHEDIKKFVHVSQEDEIALIMA
jgi:hypothetical protein